MIFDSCTQKTPSQGALELTPALQAGDPNQHPLQKHPFCRSFLFWILRIDLAVSAASTILLVRQSGPYLQSGGARTRRPALWGVAVI